MDILAKLSGTAKLVRIDESLSTILRHTIKREKSSRFIPTDYFYLTHVINPAKFFWEQKRPDIQKTPEIARKLLLGRKLEPIARVWFKNLPSFFLEEGKLDGVWVGIPGIRGSIDYRIGDSIVEFKTKDSLPETEEIVIQKYPQDIEQLAFYSALHPDNPRVNYLVFMNNVKPYQLKAYKITVTDIGSLKTLLLYRKKLLKEAIEKDDPSTLGCCRYFDTGCEFNSEKACNCENIPPLSNEPLLKSVQISFDEEFTKKLLESKQATSESEELFTTKDIIAPRKYYLHNHMNIEDTWKSDTEREEYLACLGNVMRRLSLNLNSTELQYMIKSLREPRLQIAQRWLKIKSSAKGGEEIIPYTVKVSAVKHMKYTTKPHEYHIAELAIICAAYNKSKGLIAIIYPNLEDFVQIYEVIFRESDDNLSFTKSVIDALEKSKNEEALSSLHPCPEFMNDYGKCPLMEKCHQGDTKGCTSR